MKKIRQKIGKKIKLDLIDLYYGRKGFIQATLQVGDLGFRFDGGLTKK